MLAHGEVWRPVAEYLPGVTLTAPDLLSHGASSDWAGQPDFHDDNTRALADVLSHHEAVDLVGHSFGATLALRLAVQNAERVRSLTLIEPVYFAVLRQHAAAALDAHLLIETQYREAIAAQDYTRGVQLFIDAWGAGLPWESMTPAAQQYLINRAHLVPAQYPAIFDDTQGVLRPERLARVTMPTRLVRGSDSPNITARINEALALSLPNAQQVTIAGAGHMAPVTHPQQTAQAIDDLLQVA